MARTATVVIGANYGDEGKGLMTDYFAAQSARSVVVRFNGGCQAGHTVTTPEGARHVFSHFGSGSFAGAATYLSRYFAANPVLYLKERPALLKALGYVPRILVDARAPVTTHYDMLVNQLVETYRGQHRHGSCGMGFGETIGRQESEVFGLVVRDLLNPLDVKAKLRAIRDEYLPARCRALGLPEGYAKQQYPTFFATDLLFDAFQAAAEDFLRDILVVPDAAVALADAPAIVMEGAQGLLLDQTRGAFPYVTRSNTGAQNAVAVAQEAQITALELTYVSRAYLTRHGAGPMAHELPGTPYAAVNDPTNMPNPYQGSLRFAYLDHDLLQASIAQDLADVQGSPVACHAQLAVTCLDQVSSRTRFWRDSHLQKGDLDAQLADLSDTACPLAFTAAGPSRTTIERVMPTPLAMAA